MLRILLATLLHIHYHSAYDHQTWQFCIKERRGKILYMQIYLCDMEYHQGQIRNFYFLIQVIIRYVVTA